MGIDEMTGEISAGQTLTDRERYEAMLVFLFEFWKFTGYDDLTDILSGGVHLHLWSYGD